MNKMMILFIILKKEPMKLIKFIGNRSYDGNKITIFQLYRDTYTSRVERVS